MRRKNDPNEIAEEDYENEDSSSAMYKENSNNEMVRAKLINQHEE